MHENLYSLAVMASESNLHFDSWALDTLGKIRQDCLLATLISQYFAVVAAMEDNDVRCSLVTFATTLVWAAALSPSPNSLVPLRTIIVIVKYTLLIVHCNAYQRACPTPIMGTIYSMFQHDAQLEWLDSTQMSLLLFQNYFRSLPTVGHSHYSCDGDKLNRYLETLLEEDSLLVQVLLDPRLVPCDFPCSPCPISAPTQTVLPPEESLQGIRNVRRALRKDVMYMLKAMGVMGRQVGMEDRPEFRRMRRKLNNMVEEKIPAARPKKTTPEAPASTDPSNSTYDNVKVDL